MNEVSIEGPRVAVAGGSPDNGRVAGPKGLDLSLSSLVPIDLLLSFAFHGGVDHRKLHERLPPGSLLWIDSGAFTAYTTGKAITREEYADHLRAQRGGYDYAFSLDVIGDPKTSRENTEWLWGQGLPVVPVFHFGSPLAEWRSLCRDYGYVAAGGLVPLAKDRPRVVAYLSQLVREADETETAVHSLGIAGRSTVLTARVWSADSSTVSSAPLYGNIPVYDHRRKRLVLLQAKDTAGLWRHRKDLLRYGFPLKTVMRERRWSKEERPAMFRAALLGVAQMWADARASYPRPAPARLWRPEAAPEPPEGSYAVGPPNVGEYGPDAVLPPDGPRASYSLGPGNEPNLEHTLGPRGACAPHDMPGRLDAALGPHVSSSLTTSKGVEAAAQVLSTERLSS